MNVGRWIVLSLCFVAATSWGVEPSDLRVSADDVIIDQSIEGGFLLRIRKKPAIESILITESSKDPNMQRAAYGLRNPEFHPLNGNEQRILNGEFIESAYNLYFLLDSTPQPDPVFGQAFHIFIPYVVEYGYAWSRNGSLLVHDGAFLNIRSFERKFSDYTGAFLDNPFLVRVIQEEIASRPPTGNYLEDAVTSFSNIAEASDGTIYYSDGEEDVIDKIEQILQNNRGQTIDLVFVIDTTSSMRNDIQFIQRRLTGLLESHLSSLPSLQVGLLYYRDYGDSYLTKNVGFQRDLASMQRTLNAITVAGGRDVPEAVYEALYTTLNEFEWREEAASRNIVLIGDAPPHQLPRGDIDKEKVFSLANEKAATVDVIIIPQ